MNDFCQILHIANSLTARKCPNQQRQCQTNFVGPIFGRFLPDKSFTSFTCIWFLPDLHGILPDLHTIFGRFLPDFFCRIFKKIIFPIFFILHKSCYFFIHPIFARFLPDFVLGFEPLPAKLCFPCTSELSAAPLLSEMIYFQSGEKTYLSCT